MKKDNKIYFWACDYCNISGEGILAKLFIKEYLKKKTTSVFVNIAKNNKFQKRDNFIKNKIMDQFILINMITYTIHYFS